MNIFKTSLLLSALSTLFMLPGLVHADPQVRSAQIQGCNGNNYHGGVLSIASSSGGMAHFRCGYPAYNNNNVQLWISIGHNQNGDTVYPPDGVTADSCLDQETMFLLDSKIAHTNEDQIYWFSIPVDVLPTGVRFSVECVRPNASGQGTYYVTSNTKLAAVIE